MLDAFGPDPRGFGTSRSDLAPSRAQLTAQVLEPLLDFRARHAIDVRVCKAIADCPIGPLGKVDHPLLRGGLDAVRRGEPERRESNIDVQAQESVVGFAQDAARRSAVRVQQEHCACRHRLRSSAEPSPPSPSARTAVLTLMPVQHFPRPIARGPRC
jgi:hypothetical protein